MPLGSRRYRLAVGPVCEHPEDRGITSRRQNGITNYPLLLTAISPPRMNTDEGGPPRNCSRASAHVPCSSAAHEGHPVHRRAHHGDRFGNGQQLLPHGPQAGGMLCAMTLIVAFKVDTKLRPFTAPAAEVIGCGRSYERVCRQSRCGEGPPPPYQSEDSSRGSGNDPRV